MDLSDFLRAFLQTRFTGVILSLPASDNWLTVAKNVKHNHREWSNQNNWTIIDLKKKKRFLSDWT